MSEAFVFTAAPMLVFGRWTRADSTCSRLECSEGRRQQTKTFLKAHLIIFWVKVYGKAMLATGQWHSIVERRLETNMHDISNESIYYCI